MGVIWITLSLAVVVGFLLWFFLAPAPPARAKVAGLNLVSESATRLAMMHEGSQLTVQHDASGRSFCLVKLKDRGGTEQAIAFVVREADWSTEPCDRLDRVLQEGPFPCQSTSRSPERIFRCTLTGQPKAMEFLTARLLSAVAPALGLEEEDRFSLGLEGVIDQAIWRRVNIGPLRSMGDQDQPWLWQRYSQYQMRKYNSERQEQGRDEES